jgi:beta-fructofuranosidase
MTFARPDAWVWDFWLADTGTEFHLFYLFAPKTLIDPELRHRNARIGHATSSDLHNWEDDGEVIGPGPAGSFDSTATWTGSVVHGDDGQWRMFYTGAVFSAADSAANVESIGVAVSADLSSWAKDPDLILRADPWWYEILGDSAWPEEAWRDPWVFRSASDDEWRMLITARSMTGELNGRGVVGHARSADLKEWEILPPLSDPGSGFAHLEVCQLIEVDGRPALLFSASTAALAAGASSETGGIWVIDEVDPAGPYDVRAARVLVEEHLYSGRVVTARDGTAQLLAFTNHPQQDGTGFSGTITAPMRLARDASGRLFLPANPEGTAYL